jgi:hypothetical protein
MKQVINDLIERLTYLEGLRQTPEMIGRIKELRLTIDRLKSIEERPKVPTNKAVGLCRSVLKQEKITAEMRNKAVYVLTYYQNK